MPRWAEKNNNKPQKSVAWLGIEPGTYTIEARVLTTRYNYRAVALYANLEWGNIK